ncbi:hypothetical protein [Paraglaciecola marina]|uniref:hypothetical protein n=1 Tax=Paraglaciecola marina TaxID=2500157 RepID=UPI00105C075B|nr:hypothetical protein [Paraglaciecola marina]
MYQFYIVLKSNPDWINPDTRPACKYAPVKVDKSQTPEAIKNMQQALLNRIRLCRNLASRRNNLLISSNWFSFLKAGKGHEPHLKPSSLPIIVLSGGNSNRLKNELTQSYNLAWHPVNVRAEPVYLLVHRIEFKKYVAALRGVLATYRNFHIIGWDGGSLTGFGAARAAGLAFADSLGYCPRRVILMDQDVVHSNRTRIFNYGVGSKVEREHYRRELPVLGLGVGFPTRFSPQELSDRYMARLQGEDTIPKPDDFNSPAQQAVSILAPFRDRQSEVLFADGVYPPYMVAGGEDMLMGFQLGLNSHPRGHIISGEIAKKSLEGPGDSNNKHWNVLRVDMLKYLYNNEKKTKVLWYGKPQTIETVLGILIASRNLSPKPAEVYNTSACIIERIILRLHKLNQFPEVDTRIFQFNRLE